MLDGEMRMSNLALFVGKPRASRGVPNLNVGTDVHLYLKIP
jgi:hypothetical protein